MIYSVDYCGSDSPELNDDCWWGTDHPTWESAMLAFLRPVPRTSYCRDHTVAHVFLTRNGGVIADRPNPSFDPERMEREAAADDRLWQSEYATQMGMALGCDGYNDAHGW